MPGADRAERVLVLETREMAQLVGGDGGSSGRRYARWSATPGPAAGIAQEGIDV